VGKAGTASWRSARGWGGFAYQLKTLFPNTTYIIVDLPPTLLFSATYLKAAFPDARMKFYGERPEQELFDDLDQTDFVYLPAHALARARVPAVDVAVNLASFQEMTTEQVTGYVQKLADSGCRQLYSLNRDRSR
jgi:putative sugar O-methyltransferase